VDRATCAGYDNRLLGPKAPAIESHEVDGDTVLTADHYVPVGGLRRVAATAELRLALPWFGRNVFGHLFADAGRVWTTDSRFEVATAAKDGERMFYTTGGGVGYYTPVGAIRVDLGYKLNPSVLDVRHAGDVARTVQEGRPITTAPVDNGMRYHVHLSLGLFF
jgi:outer membrane protein assembly factor BamA